MKPRITLITLGVADLERSLVFYRDGLGLPTQGVVGREFEHGAVAFFELQGGLRLALWSRKDIAHDTQLPESPPSPVDFTLAHNVNSHAEVDEVMEQARRAGAAITKAAGATFYGGYAGYFQDPDGHLWEVAWNPPMDRRGLTAGLAAELSPAGCVGSTSATLCARPRGRAKSHAENRRMNDAAQAIMAVSFFGSIAITVRSVASAWGKRIENRRSSPSTDAIDDRLARIESAVDVIAIEVERITEAQRFSARLDADRAGHRIPAPSAPTHAHEGRTITPH